MLFELLSILSDLSTVFNYIKHMVKKVNFTEVNGSYAITFVDKNENVILQIIVESRDEFVKSIVKKYIQVWKEYINRELSK